MPEWLVVIVTLIAVPAWAIGAYATVKGWMALPPGRWTMPIFSTDPALITEEGRKWRRVFFTYAAIFATAILGTLALGLMLSN